MKNSIKISVLISIFLAGFSCNKLEDFLDKAPGVDVTEDNIFTSRQNAESYVSTLYQYGMVSIFPNREAAVISSPTGASSSLAGTLSGATDESENEANFPFAQQWNSASIIPGNIIGNEDSKYHGRWKAIRNANILLERIDEALRFYTEPDYTLESIDAKKKSLESDLIHIYRHRNRIVHNAHDDENILFFLAKKAHNFSSSLIRCVLHSHMIHNRNDMPSIVNFIKGRLDTLLARLNARI